MTIQDIENLTFAELKASGKKIIDELGGNELAARYVQARTDAKQRDEKLAEQGVTITNLNAALEAVSKGRDALVSQVKELTAQAAKLTENNRTLAADVNVVGRRAVDAEALAKARRAALADVMKLIAPLLAAE